MRSLSVILLGALAFAGAPAAQAETIPTVPPVPSEPPAEGSGTLTGVIEGEHGAQVRLVYRELPRIVERGNGWEVTHPMGRAVRVGATGRFSVSVPGCPGVESAIGCAGTTYEAWATYSGQRCSETSFVMNVVSGEANEVLYPHEGRAVPLNCHAVASHHKKKKKKH